MGGRPQRWPRPWAALAASTGPARSCAAGRAAKRRPAAAGGEGGLRGLESFGRGFRWALGWLWAWLGVGLCEPQKVAKVLLFLLIDHTDRRGGSRAQLGVIFVEWVRSHRAHVICRASFLVQVCSGEWENGMHAIKGWGGVNLVGTTWGRFNLV